MVTKVQKYQSFRALSIGRLLGRQAVEVTKMHLSVQTLPFLLLAIGHSLPSLVVCLRFHQILRVILQVSDVSMQDTLLKLEFLGTATGLNWDGPGECEL